MTDLASFTWGDALQDFLLHKEASFASKTVRCYRIQLSGLAERAAEGSVAFGSFSKHHLDRSSSSEPSQAKAG